jgi:prepilin-type N-terminal cleavage/methylation domain-containing protein
MSQNIRNLSQAKRVQACFKFWRLVSKNQQSGFTIIESLMAIVVVTVLLVGITPPLFLVVGTRVQNQRAEQAMQLAQREIDRVRVLIERGDFENTQLPPSAGASTTKSISAPQSFSTAVCTNTSDANTACPVEVNEKIEGPDFYVQRFRTKEILDGGQVIAFNMGVRVYSFAAAKNVGKLETQEASLKMTTADGSQSRYPLAVIYTTVARSDRKESLEKYKNMVP